MTARQHENVGVAVFCEQLGAARLQRADERNAVDNAQLGGAALELLAVVGLGDWTDQAELSPGMARQMLDERPLVFLAVDPRDAEDG